MPTVQETLQLPGDLDPSSVVVEVEAVGSTSGAPVPVYDPTADVAYAGVSRPAVDDDGQWSLDLAPNSRLVPGGSKWKIVVYARRWGPSRPRYVDVPDGAGPYEVQDILSPAPANLPSSTLGHSSLSGLDADDHPQYLRVDGSRDGTSIQRWADANFATDVGPGQLAFYDDPDDASPVIFISKIVEWVLGFGLDTYLWRAAAAELGVTARIRQQDPTRDDHAVTRGYGDGRYARVGDFRSPDDSDGASALGGPVLTPFPGWWSASVGSADTIDPDEIFFQPMDLYRAQTIEAAKIQVNSAGGDLRLGIYDLDAKMMPDNLLYTLGVIDGSTTGGKEISGLSIDLDPGRYAVAIHAESSTNLIYQEGGGFWTGVDPTDLNRLPVLMTNGGGDAYAGGLPAAMGDTYFISGTRADFRYRVFFQWAPQ